jgi:hypothetical protein
VAQLVYAALSNQLPDCRIARNSNLRGILETIQLWILGRKHAALSAPLCHHVPLSRLG